MRRMWMGLGVTLLSLLAAVGRVSAADLPVKARPAVVATPAAYNWSGVYAGAHAGYGWGDGRVAIGIVDPSGVTQTIANAGGFPRAYSFERDGYVGGGQIGFNQQVGLGLWGAEADLSATGLKGSSTVFTPACPICALPNTSTVTQNMDWFGTVRGRVGITQGQWLLYGTGGLAYGHVRYSYRNTNVPFGGALTIADARSATELGWTAGGGVEYGFGRWSAKVEYLYYDLGSRTLSAPNPLAPPALGVRLTPSFENTGSMVRAGLNYRFN